MSIPSSFMAAIASGSTRPGWFPAHDVEVIARQVAEKCFGHLGPAGILAA
jgi:hypothetical protein